MRPPSRSPRSIAALLPCALALAACTDPARITSPTRGDTLDAPLSKQGTTADRILFFSGSPSDVFSIAPDGTGLIQLTTSDAWDRDPAWAPDGKRVLIASGADNGVNLAIYAMNSDGTGVTRLTSPGLMEDDFNPRALGKDIAYNHVDGTVLSYTIWKMAADGSDRTRLTDGPGDYYPAPSPSGKQIAFVRLNDVYVVDVDTRALVNLTGSVAWEDQPAWSPNGKQIVFTRVVDPTTGSTDIFVMNADGTEVTRLTDTPDYEQRPQWSPDGKWIAFTATYGLGQGVWRMAADGTSVNAVIDAPLLFANMGAWAR